MALADQSSDLKQLVAASFDVTNQALKTVSQSTSQLTLTATSDSVTAVPVPVSTTAAGTAATTGVVLPAAPAAGVGSVALYVEATSTLTGPQVLTVEVSPDPAGVNGWVATTITATTPTTSGVTVLAGPTKIAALWVRVSIAAAVSSGTFTTWLVSGN